MLRQGRGLPGAGVSIFQFGLQASAGESGNIIGQMPANRLRKNPANGLN